MFLRGLEILRRTGGSGYPFNVPAIRQMTKLEFRSNVTFFVGENGSGKSTLLEAMAYQCGFNTAGGGRNNSYEVDASEAVLGDAVRLSWLPKITNGFFLRAETFYHFASHLDSMPESLRKQAAERKSPNASDRVRRLCGLSPYSFTEPSVMP